LNLAAVRAHDERRCDRGAPLAHDSTAGNDTIRPALQNERGTFSELLDRCWRDFPQQSRHDWSARILLRAFQRLSVQIDTSCNDAGNDDETADRTSAGQECHGRVRGTSEKHSGRAKASVRIVHARGLNDREAVLVNTLRRFMSRSTVGLLLAATAASIGCMPPSWGAGALLHPARRPLTVPTPVGALNVVLQGDGVLLRGWQFQDHKVSVGTVIFLHGSADNRAAGVGVARHLSQRGFTVLAYDSRAHGESEGRACTYGFFEKRDLSRVIDTVEQRPIIVLGTSLGAAVGLQAAAEDDRIGGVIAISSFSDLRTVATERAPFFATRAEIEQAFRLAEQQAGFAVDAVSPVAAASRIAVPVLLIHGANDRETPPDHSRRIYQALRGEKRLLIVPGRGHNDTLTAEVWSEIDAWIAHRRAAA
jgi:uncharacterized protein